MKSDPSFHERPRADSGLLEGPSSPPANDRRRRRLMLHKQNKGMFSLYTYDGGGRTYLYYTTAAIIWDVIAPNTLFESPGRRALVVNPE
uniref:Uncharacterized protein n=1 Tax=Steinernema glaseri TaxID=37863 RepID=A0A1I7Z899_9BILA